MSGRRTCEGRVAVGTIAGTSGVRGKMAAPRFDQGIVNPEAEPTRPRITQPAPPPSYNTRTVPTSATRGTQANPPAARPPATLFPIPTGKPATSVAAPGGMISQAPSGTRPPTSMTRGSQTPAAMQSRSGAVTATPPAPVAPVAPTAPAAPTAPTAAPAATTEKPRRKKYTPPEGYDRLAGYSPDASPDQILLEKAQIYARNLARGIEMSDAEVEKRFQERLKRFQDTGEPSKNKDPEDAVAPAPTVPTEEVVSPEESALQQKVDDLMDRIVSLQEQLNKALENKPTTPEQAQETTQAGTSQLQTLAQSLAPKPAGGSLANLDRTRVGQMLQVAAPIMFTGSFADVVAAIIAAGITPTAPELAWLEGEVAKYRAG